MLMAISKLQRSDSALELLKASSNERLAVSRQTQFMRKRKLLEYEARCIDCRYQQAARVRKVHACSSSMSIVLVVFRACVMRMIQAVVTTPGRSPSLEPLRELELTEGWL